MEVVREGSIDVIREGTMMMEVVREEEPEDQSGLHGLYIAECEGDEEVVVQEVMKNLRQGRKRSDVSRSSSRRSRKSTSSSTRSPKSVCGGGSKSTATEASTRSAGSQKTTTTSLTQRRQGGGAAAQQAAQPPNVFYSVDGDIVPAYPVEFNSDAASTVIGFPGEGNDSRCYTHNHNTARSFKKSQSRFTYNESLQQDIIEEIGVVKFRYDVHDEDGPHNSSNSRQEARSPKATMNDEFKSRQAKTEALKKSNSMSSSPRNDRNTTSFRDMLPPILRCSNADHVSTEQYYVKEASSSFFSPSVVTPSPKERPREGILDRIGAKVTACQAVDNVLDELPVRPPSSSGRAGYLARKLNDLTMCVQGRGNNNGADDEFTEFGGATAFTTVYTQGTGLGTEFMTEFSPFSDGSEAGGATAKSCGTDGTEFGRATSGVSDGGTADDMSMTASTSH